MCRARGLCDRVWFQSCFADRESGKQIAKQIGCNVVPSSVRENIKFFKHFTFFVKGDNGGSEAYE